MKPCQVDKVNLTRTLLVLLVVVMSVQPKLTLLFLTIVLLLEHTPVLQVQLLLKVKH